MLTGIGYEIHHDKAAAFGRPAVIAAQDCSTLHEITTLLDQVAQVRDQEPDGYLEIGFDRSAGSGAGPQLRVSSVTIHDDVALLERGNQFDSIEAALAAVRQFHRKATDSQWYEYIATVDFITRRCSTGEPMLRIVRCVVAGRHAAETTPRHLLPLRLDGHAVTPFGLGMRFDRRRRRSAASIEAALQAAGLVIRGFGFDVDMNSWDTQDGVAVASLTLLRQGGQSEHHSSTVAVRKQHSHGILNTTYRSHTATSFRVITSHDEGTGNLDVRVVKGHLRCDNFVVYVDERHVSQKRLLRILEDYLDGYRPAASDLPTSRRRR